MPSVASAKIAARFCASPAEAAIAIGASRVGEVVYDEMGGFQVMADPEGNEFCLINGPTAITA